MSLNPLQIAILLTLAHVPCLARAASDAPANVLLIITDEHNFRTLGCYRELLPREQAEMWGRNVVVPTPHLDRLAKEGVICARAYATAPVCSPCRAAMLTGRYPHATGVPTNNMVLDRSVPTLADRLNDGGYGITNKDPYFNDPRLPHRWLACWANPRRNRGASHRYRFSLGGNPSLEC